MSERAEMELVARTLEPGESIRTMCPFCGGGSSKERSLSLTHRDDGALLFHCYRANCGAAGALGGVGLVRTRPPAQKKRRAKENIEDRLEEFPYYGVYWGMSANYFPRLGIRWDAETARMALPMYAPNGVLRGRLLRVPPGDGRQPKVLTWPYSDECTLAWNTVGTRDAVIVVEDIISCLRLGLHGFSAVALNGTHMSDESLGELDNNATDVVWALDRDAIAKSMRWHEQCRLYFRNSAVLAIDKDFKDMTDEEVERWVSEISWLRSSKAATPSTVFVLPSLTRS